MWLYAVRRYPAPRVIVVMCVVELIRVGISRTGTKRGVPRTVMEVGGGLWISARRPRMREEYLMNSYPVGIDKMEIEYSSKLQQMS